MGVIIGMDPHKRSATIEVFGQYLGTGTGAAVAVSIALYGLTGPVVGRLGTRAHGPRGADNRSVGARRRPDGRGRE